MQIATALMADGWFMLDDFAQPQQVRELRDCVRRRRQLGKFHAARIGGGAAAQHLEHIRGDEICWLQEPLYAAERQLLGSFEALRLQLNRATLLGLFELEVHYAWYAAGAAYARHVDQLQGSDARRVSIVLYLNEAWTEQDGGQLRLHREAHEQLDIEPIAGRLVGFLSESQSHEVLRCQRERLSITGWLRVRG